MTEEEWKQDIENRFSELPKEIKEMCAIPIAFRLVKIAAKVLLEILEIKEE